MKRKKINALRSCVYIGHNYAQHNLNYGQTGYVVTDNIDSSVIRFYPHGQSDIITLSCSDLHFAEFPSKFPEKL